MNDEIETVEALMFRSEVFCSKVEAALDDLPANQDREELRLKLSQCRNLLGYLQVYFDENKLLIEIPSVRTSFRTLITSLLWVAFYARHIVDRKTFRMLVMIQYGFSLLLGNHIVAGMSRSSQPAE